MSSVIQSEIIKKKLRNPCKLRKVENILDEKGNFDRLYKVLTDRTRVGGCPTTPSGCRQTLDTLQYILFPKKILTSGLSPAKCLFKIIRSTLEAFFRLVKDENLLVYSGLRMPCLLLVLDFPGYRACSIRLIYPFSRLVFMLLFQSN